MQLKTIYLVVYTFYTMTDTKKMMNAIINGQSAIKQELSSKIDRIDQKVDSLSEKVDNVETNVTNRIDILGKHLAYLEDDTPTREEYDELEKRVDKVERKASSAL